jgi:hypothetical protein
VIFTIKVFVVETDHFLHIYINTHEQKKTNSNKSENTKYFSIPNNLFCNHKIMQISLKKTTISLHNKSVHTKYRH